MNMARRTGASARIQALAKAADAVARRDADRIAREKAVQAALAEFFQAQGEVERIHADAERTAAPFDAAMREAVRALDRLGETRTGIAELTGVSLIRLREYLAENAVPFSRALSAPARATRHGPAAGSRSSPDREATGTRMG